MTDYSNNREKATDALEKAEREMRMNSEVAGGKSDDGEKVSKQAEDAASLNSEETGTEEANPPRTTTGWFTAPKFGSASSGGGEIEPGPERD